MGVGVLCCGWPPATLFGSESLVSGCRGQGGGRVDYIQRQSGAPRACGSTRGLAVVQRALVRRYSTGANRDLSTRSRSSMNGCVDGWGDGQTCCSGEGVEAAWWFPRPSQNLRACHTRPLARVDQPRPSQSLRTCHPDPGRAQAMDQRRCKAHNSRVACLIFRSASEQRQSLWCHPQRVKQNAISTAEHRASRRLVSKPLRGASCCRGGCRAERVFRVSSEF